MKATPPHHLRLDPEVNSEVKTIADATGLTQLEVIRQMVRAGVRAIRENGYKLQLPLHLVVGVDEGKKSSGDRYPSKAAEGMGLNEPKPPKKNTG